MHSNCGAGEDSWESLGMQGEQTSPSQRNQPWMFVGRTNAKAEAPILWPLEAPKNQLIGEDPDAGKDWRREEKGVTEDEMVGWHHQLNGHEFELTPGDGERQGNLACCSPWGHKESDVMEWLNNNIPQKIFLNAICLWISFFLKTKKKKAPCPLPICWHAGHKFTQVSLLHSLSGRTNANSLETSVNVSLEETPGASTCQLHSQASVSLVSRVLAFLQFATSRDSRSLFFFLSFL